ncbi:MAG: carbohydrate binding domain-containing protein [Acidobacteriota bacterium]
MVIKLNFTTLIARLSLAIGAVGGCSLMVAIIISRFVIGTLADDRRAVTRDMLQVPVEYFPGSARLNARLAAAELSEGDPDLASAESYAQRAVTLSPYDYRFRLILASIKEAGGDRAAAEESLKYACALAPNYWSVHYRLGNLLVREGKLTQSLEEFRIAITANPELLPETLDLVWRASGGDVSAVQTASGSDPKAKLTLAQFLLTMSRPVEAASVFSSIDRSDRTASPQTSSAFLNSLIAAGKLETARDLWIDLAGSDRQSALIWNGGFEANIEKNFAQFEWSFGRTEYARLAIDAAVARTGSRSLRIEFAGRDTTQLDNEIRQLVPLRPGVQYRLECYAKASGLETPEGPRVVVTDRVSSSWIAASEPVVQGSNDWQHLAVDFVAPENANGGAAGIFVSIKRKPRFSYDEPTLGTVWFDDFSMRER